MADVDVGIRGYVNSSTFSGGRTGESRCPALARLPFREGFRGAPHWLVVEKPKLSRSGRAPWEAGRAGIRALAMMQKSSLGETHVPNSAADDEKDQSMFFRRTVFEHEDWTRHRSSDRHSRHMLSVLSSRVIRSLGPPVLRLTFIASFVAAVNEAVLAHLLPLWVPLLHVSSIPFQLTAPALALLLVFRTNASYGRFDEARKAWESNVNRSRDFSRQALSWIRSSADSGKLERLLRYCVALQFCLKNHLTPGGSLNGELKGLLNQDELEVLLRFPHKPNYVLQTMSDIINNCSLSDMERARLDRNITQFHDNLGTCERILKTPIPLSYTRLTSRFLVMWHTALPFALWDQCSWVIIPATFFSAGALFCIEEVGVLIEEPLSMISLESICITIKNNVEGLVQAHAENLILSKKLSRKEALLNSEVNGILKRGEQSSSEGRKTEYPKI